MFEPRRKVSSFGLTLYKLSAQKPALGNMRPARPAGCVVWLRLDHLDRMESALALSSKLAGDAGIKALITCDGDGADLGAQTFDLAPPDHPAAVADFLDHWQPQAIVMFGAALAPILSHIAQTRHIPLLMTEAQPPHLPRGPEWLYLGLLRQNVRAFHAIAAVDENAARSYRKLGATNVMRLGRMTGGGAALPHNEPERATLARNFATRPVWLAVDVPPEEEDAVIDAHRSALRLSHRLLLILVPQTPARAPLIAEKLSVQENWVVARRELDQDPDPETSVYIADSGAEYGLWYRLAPVSFLGGSLHGSGSARSPMEPAALGSAIIHGRRVGAFGVDFGALGAALGAAPVASGAELAEVLIELLAPDRAARLAHAAWSVASEGSEVTDRICQMLVHLTSEAT